MSSVRQRDGSKEVKERMRVKRDIYEGGGTGIDQTILLFSI